MNPLLRLAAVGAIAATAYAADFSYYMLSLSYAPEFCAHAANPQASECGPGRPAFVVHGLWPQNENGRGPERCGPARPVPADLARSMIGYFPAGSLLQHEWATHGTCSGLSMADYFAAVRKLRDSVRTPPELETLRAMKVVSPFELSGYFSRANPGIPRDGFRVACYPDGGFEEIRICFDRSFIARGCTGAAECTKNAVRLLPGRPKR